MNESKIDADKTLIIHSNMPVMLIGNLIGCLPLALYLWNDEYAVSLTIWVSLIYVLTLFRFFHYRSLHVHSATIERIKQQQQAYFLFALCSGLIWGSSGIFFFNPEVVTEFTFLMLLLVAMSSSSMTSLSSHPIIYAAFAFPTMLPLTIMMFLQGTGFYIWLFYGTMTYLLVTLAFSRNLHKVIHNSLILKYQNLDLVDGLKKQTETANKANKDKSRFLAAASHDLRQPLHAVNLFVESLETKISQSNQLSDLDQIRKGLDTLGELFNSLLDISRLDSDSMHINKIDFQIGDMLQKLTDQFSLEAKAKNLKFTLHDCQQFVHSDPILLERLIRNLLSNAIHYTRKGSIKIYCDHGSKGQIQIHIVDSGIGIPEKDQDIIFNEFYQLHNPERDRNKGLGLGLAIVRRISNLLEHPIQLNSKLEQGTEFVINIDKGQFIQPNAVAQPIYNLENKLENLKVLVIDNEHDILVAMQDLLTSWKCQVKTIESADKALEIVKDGYVPQFILSDYRMPGAFNGSEIVEKIRQITGFIPALIITGDTGADVINEIKEKDLIILNKPLKPAQLRLAMTRLLNKNKPH